MSDDAMQPRDETAGGGAEVGAPEASPTPVYDQAFFLDLARPREGSDEARAEARERWNAWRRDPANADIEVTFVGVDFRSEENRGISFSGFEFGDRARFDSAKFGDGMRFIGTEFGEAALFDGAIFGNWTQFTGAIFGQFAAFSGAVFGSRARFSGTIFGGNARFDRVKFGDQTQFIDSVFNGFVQFEETVFGGMARFDRVMFGIHAGFDRSVFGDRASFMGARFGTHAEFIGTTFGKEAQFIDAIFGSGANFSGIVGESDIECRRSGWGNIGSLEFSRQEKDYLGRREGDGYSPSRFSNIIFSRVQFRGFVSFARRSFERSADFTDARFDEPPDFDGATNLQRIDFTGARAAFAPAKLSWWKPYWTTDSTVAIRLRTLRSQIEATKNHDFERDLYIEERKAERGIHLARLWKSLRPRRLIKTALASIGGLPRLPKIDVFAGWGVSVVRWPERPRNRRGDARPAMIGEAPGAVRLRRAYRRNGARFLAALGPLLGHLLWIAVMAVYWVLSDYGRSWLRPALCLGVVLVLFHGLGPVDGITARALGAKRGEIVAAAEAARPGSGREVGAAWDEAAKLYAVANSIPFVGPLTIDGEVKKFLFCGPPPPAPAAGELTPKPCVPLPPASLQAATIVQSLLSILLVFFIGLAWRNYFRLK